MDLFTRFNRRNTVDRHLDTLIGISKGLIADGKINQAEAEYLLSWLIRNQPYSNNPMIGNLLQKVSLILEDGVLDEAEAADLLETLRTISGEDPDRCDLPRPTTLPLDAPPPQIVFEDRHFMFAGTCVFGTRKECQDAVERLGGRNASTVTSDLDYLVIGTYATDDWMHEPCGVNIERALGFRDSGRPIVIIDEETWIEQAGL